MGPVETHILLASSFIWQVYNIQKQITAVNKRCLESTFYKSSRRWVDANIDWDCCVSPPLMFVWMTFLLSEAFVCGIGIVMKTNWTENNRMDFSALKFTSEELCLPLDLLASTTQGGTLSNCCSSQCGGGLCVIELFIMCSIACCLSKRSSGWLKRKR